MQGRLSSPVDGRIQAFPAATWQAEFGRAAEAGLDAIEWIFDAPDNPLLDDGGVADIRRAIEATGTAVWSVCADYFMDAPLHRGTDAEIAARVDVLQALLVRARDVGAEHIVLPCVDQSAIRDDDDQRRLVEVLADVTPSATAHRVELHLETSLAPNAFATLLGRFPPTVRANYDSGNSASLGYDVSEEFAAYGDRIGSLHIKDRVRGGTTVPLGQGDTNFPALFDAIDRVGYRRLFTLQVARGESGGEVALARRNRDFVVRYLTTAADPT
jgi:hexulose-6-phosphate isomerase